MVVSERAHLIATREMDKSAPNSFSIQPDYTLYQELTVATTTIYWTAVSCRTRDAKF